MECIGEILSSKRTTLSFEVFPPKKEANIASVVAAAGELSLLKPDFISVTYGAGGTTRSYTQKIASSIKDLGVPPLSHLTCIGDSVESLRSNIGELKASGIKNVLALRGDIPSGASIQSATIKGYAHASDLVALLKQEGFCVGGACYPEGHPESPNRERDIDFLKYKVAAGVDFLTTQMFFDNDIFYTFLYRLSTKGIDVPVLAGIMPITSATQVKRMVELSNAFIPKSLLAICDRFKESPKALFQAGIAYATEQIIDLVSQGVRGIHIYTMNKPTVAKAIMSNIDSILC